MGSVAGIAAIALPVWYIGMDVSELGWDYARFYICHALLFITSVLPLLLGLVGLFCSATNAPLASMVLSLELFGSANLYAFALVCVVCFVLSGKSSLYSSQLQPYR